MSDLFGCVLQSRSSKNEYGPLPFKPPLHGLCQHIQLTRQQAEGLLALALLTKSMHLHQLQELEPSTSIDAPMFQLLA